ncbi:MAG: MFS transporter [Vallitaleaceae bacterium]|nr:MFS transporter [Vallitaleaceae bacterium]
MNSKKQKKFNYYLGYVSYSGSLFFYYFSMGIFISILSLFLEEKNISTPNIAFIVSATAIFTVAIQPLIGVLSDFIPQTKRLLYFCTILTLFTGISFIYFRNVIILFVLNGLTQAIIISIMPLFDTMAEKSEYSYGSIRVWGSIGFAVSVQLAGIVYDVISPNAVFVMFSISTILSFLFLVPIRLSPEKAKKKKRTSTKGSLLLLFQNKGFILFLILSFLILGMHYCNIAYMPMLVVSMGGSATHVGMILLFQTIFELPVLLITDRLFERFSFRSIMLMISSLMAIRFFWYSLLPGTQWITAMFFFQALTTTLFFVLSIKVVLHMIDVHYVNTALALGSMIGKGIGALAFQLIGGQLIDRFGIHVLYQFLGLIALIAFFVSLFFRVDAKEMIPLEQS